MGIQTSLDAVMGAGRLVDSLRLADDLAFEASRDGGARTIRVLTSALDSDDQIAAIAATHALAQIFDQQADVALSRLLSSDRGFLREHAAWALSLRLPRFDTVGRLIGLVSEGGFGGMLAQRTLEQWASPVAEHVAIGLESALLGIDEPAVRYRLVETLGLVRKSVATPALLRIATDFSEEESVRVAAVSALGQRRGDREIVAVLDDLARSEGYLADVARLSLVDLSAESARADPLAAPSRQGLTVAQLFLHADLDADLSQAGSGDNGGIATLLVRLGDALIADDDAFSRVERVITLSRGSVAEALQGVIDLGAGGWGHAYGRLPLLSEPVQSASAWPLRVAARRGIRRMLRAAGGVDLLHLRMADVGSLAAADVARELDIPVVFTVAPDPHAVIHSLDLSRVLTRQNFGEVDEIEHFWFRTHLVQQLAANAAHTVLFPRPSLARDMRELVGIDITAHPERHTIVPEGIDLEVVDRAVMECAGHAAGQPATPALHELRDLLAELPERRRDLPLLVSVGRFHRVKGMATIVDAWANGPLADRANLLLIGGDLVDPSADEREQLDLMNAIVSPQRRFESGLLLSGHRRNDTVARWVAAARFGVPGLAAPRGIYVCGSLKEEFGIALLEAMGSGLLVVAPDGGGPATYVQPGVTGFLARTWDVTLLRSAMVDALAASGSETTADRAALSRRTVEDSFTIQAMARALATVYRGVQDEESESRGRSFAAR
ncbi:MAG: glycosyltransferase [Actinomycetota bacterium]